jgi:inositol phosphorylceramide mannosyltransferase catalytic subunit
MIPKIIHQTWKTSNLPDKFRAYQKTWIAHHPDWEYRFYDDAACRALVQNFFPDLLAVYDGCRYPVQRADIFRYLVVAARGGIYADIDMECYKNMEPLLTGRECVFGVETILSPRQTQLLNHRYSERIANCIFAARNGHPVFERIIGEVFLRLEGRYPAGEVLETTGPGMLTDVVQQNRENYDLHILPQICWLPPNDPYYPNVFPFNLHMYARHHFSGTWKNDNDKNEKFFVTLRSAGFLEGIKETLCGIRELYYKLPPSPVWREDFCFRKENTSPNRQ